MQLLLGEVGEGTRPRILEIEEHGVRKEGRVDGVVRQSEPLHQVTTRGPGIGVKQALEALDLGFEASRLPRLPVGHEIRGDEEAECQREQDGRDAGVEDRVVGHAAEAEGGNAQDQDNPRHAAHPSAR